MTEFKRHLPFIMASVLCLPFLLHLLAYLIVCAIPGRPDFMDVFVLYGALFVGGFRILSLPVLLLVSISVFAAWFQKVKTVVEIAFISIYSIVMLVDIGFVVFCFVTNWTFDL
jgi:hypothetical protein